MKKSKVSQEKTRRVLIEIAVTLIAEKGFEKTTMREISRKAKLSDATIYHYFSTKEMIVLGYIHLRQIQAVETLKKIPDFDTYSLQEKLHTYFETIFESYLPDRPFVLEAVQLAHRLLLSHFEEQARIKDIFITQIREFLRLSIEREEIPDQSIEGIIPHLIFDVYLMVLLHWAKDNSPQCERTTQLTDMATGFSVSVLKQGMISKAMDLGMFFLRSHFTEIFYGKK